MTICDSSLRKVVWRELDVDAVAHKDADAVPTHAARYCREDYVLTVVDLYLKECVRLFIHDDTR